ncbi:hypothetical protein C453_02394 [Haloferax elongans ATCC BAA-1513]|uniref:Uncharacterized protein n=1 Tax=Haloferax elongans ATCC BAA-1513 TaxID=1230453 RepID=M0HTS1_HALEO|nr:hypothetical protein C453_02394 [Haloferax elongans ATCC BAA-1513]
MGRTLISLVSKKTKLIIVGLVTASLFRAMDPQPPFSNNWILLGIAGILSSAYLWKVYREYQSVP